MEVDTCCFGTNITPDQLSSLSDPADNDTGDDEGVNVIADVMPSSTFCLQRMGVGGALS
jgi:hypothetical protein